jgi:putative hemolysin
MIVFLIIVIAVLLFALVLVSAMQPETSSLSTFELERRSRKGRTDADYALRKQALRGDLLTLQHITTLLLLFIITSLLVVLTGWLLGLFIALIILLLFGALARIYVVRDIAAMIYERIEKGLLHFVEKASWLFAIIRIHSRESEVSLGSREELEHLVSESMDVLSPSEKNLIIHGLRFGEKQVKEIMTPKGMIDFIKKTELLGPLVLSELHDKGHSRLPVISKDIDHVVGILHTKDLLTLEDKKSVTAESAMEKKVYYVHEDDTLEHALAAFLRARHHLFIVVNEFRETVGLITIEDVIESMLGRKIVDEDDVHDDIRAVASKNPDANNQPEQGRDI